MTDRELFKASFLMKCAEDGLSVDQIKARAKMARDTMTKKAFSGGDALGALGTAAGLTGRAGIGLGIGALALGALGGTAAGNVVGQIPAPGEDPTVDELQGKELVRELRRLSEEARTRTAARRRREANPPVENRSIL